MNEAAAGEVVGAADCAAETDVEGWFSQSSSSVISDSPIFPASDCLVLVAAPFGAWPFSAVADSSRPASVILCKQGA